MDCSILAARELCADRGLLWLARNLSQFHPWQRGRRPEPDLFRLKALCELALMCLLLKGHAQFGRDERVLGFIKLASEVYGEPLFRDRLFRSQRLFVPIALLSVVLEAYGLRCAESQHERIQGAVAEGNLCASERPVHRILEIRHLLDRGGFRHTLPSYDELARQSILAKQTNVIYMNDEDAYAFTHAIFYLTDFGLLPLQFIPTRLLSGAQWTIQQLLGIYLLARNWDLVGELLICSHALRCRPSLLCRSAWVQLLGSQLASGAVMGRYFSAAKAGRYKRRRNRAYVFEQCYHPTLVAVLAGALSMR